MSLLDSIGKGLKFFLMSLGVSSSSPAKKAPPLVKPAPRPEPPQ